MVGVRFPLRIVSFFAMILCSWGYTRVDFCIWPNALVFDVRREWVDIKKLCAPSRNIGEVLKLKKTNPVTLINCWFRTISQSSYTNGGKLEWSAVAHKFLLIRGKSGCNVRSLEKIPPTTGE